MLIVKSVTRKVFQLKAFKHLREESHGVTRLLYHCNYWDGPLSGVMLWEGKRCWFNCLYDGYADAIEIPDREEYENNHGERSWTNGKGEVHKYTLELDDYQEVYTTRIYNVFETPEKTMLGLDSEHDLFRRYVGTHTDYDSEGKRGRGADIGAADGNGKLGDLMPYAEHDKFYNRDPSTKPAFVPPTKVIGMFRL